MLNKELPEKLTPEQAAELQEAEFFEKMFMKTGLGFWPYSLINQVYGLVYRKSCSLIFALAAVYLTGYVYGVRAERQRRRKRV